MAIAHPRDLDCNWIHPGLALGGAIPNRTLHLLTLPPRFHRVVDLRSEERDDEEALAALGIRLLHLPTEDLQPISTALLWSGVEWVREALAAGETTLIHCQHGIGRSALLSACVLVSLGNHPKTALHHLKTVRPKVSPSPEQLHCFIRWTGEWFSRTGNSSPPVTWRELAAVSYADLR